LSLFWIKTRRATRRSKKSTLVRARTPAKARVVAKPATMVAKAKTPARARAVARPMAPSHRKSSLQSGQCNVEGWEVSPGPFLFAKGVKKYAEKSF
jgi:hypothetical protein